MTTQPSATPRTDKAIALMCHVAGVDVTFARTLETELAAARAECEKLTEQRDKCVSCWTDACTERDMMCTELARLRAESALANARCPHVVSSNEGTHHCALAESTVAALEAQLAAARKDSQRLDWLVREDIVKFLDRTAIDAAMTNSNHKTT